MPDKISKISSRKKNVLFKVIAFTLPLFIIIIAETSLRIFSYGGSMKLFVEHKVEGYEDYYIVNPFVGLKYFNRFTATESTNDIFLKKKPKNGFRIFVMGSSTIFGFPYDKNLMASRILHEKLNDSYPTKYIEIINTSLTAINSVTLRDFINQIVHYEPDAILIYAGHNEFYGAFGVGSNETLSKKRLIRELHFKLMNLRVYQLIRSGIIKFSTALNQKEKDSETKGTLMKRIVKDENIDIDSKSYDLGIHQFEENLSYILNKVDNNNIPVIVSDLVSNVEMTPFVENFNPNHRAAVTYREAKNALNGRDSLTAADLFYKAKDLDPIRFRASEDINKVIYNLVNEHDATLVSNKMSFSSKSPDKIVGNNLITEHVHPNINGQFLLAESFYNSIVSSELIAPVKSEKYTKTNDYYRKNWSYTPLDSMIGVYKVGQLKSYWPFTPMEEEIEYRKLVNPVGKVQQVAFKIISDPEVNAEDLHLELAEYYKNNNRLDLAAKEYEALIYINPFWSDYYNLAAKALFDLNDLYKVEKYLNRSLKYKQTYFANAMLGEIEFIKHNYNRAIHLFTQAFERAKEENVEIQSLTFIASRMYYIYGLQNNKGAMQQVRLYLQKLGATANIPIIPHKFEYSSYIPYDIVEPFQSALKYAETNVDTTIYYLSQCLQINDCPVVNLSMGDALYYKQDLRALKYYQKAYDAYAKDPGYLSRLCMAFLLNNKPEKGEIVLNELIAVNPDHHQISRLKEIIDVLK